MNALIERIGELIAEHGSLRAAARWLNCDPGYLSRLQSGEKNDPGPRLLLNMDLLQIVGYARIECPDAGVFEPMFNALPAPAYIKDGNTVAMRRAAGLSAGVAAPVAPTRQHLNQIADIMRSIDAYAHDYRYHGKLAPMRDRAERELRAALTAAKPAPEPITDAQIDAVWHGFIKLNNECERAGEDPSPTDCRSAARKALALQAGVAS